MEKPGKFIFTIIAIILNAFIFFQVLGHLGRQSQGWSITYIIIYLILSGACMLFLSIFGIILESATEDVSDNDLIDMNSIFDFGENQEFRLFNGSMRRILAGVFVGLLFFLFISTTASGAFGFKVAWQKSEPPLTIEGGNSTIGSPEHQAELSRLGVSENEEVYFSSVPPGVTEDLTFNYFSVSIIATLLFLVPSLLGIELDAKKYFFVVTIAALINSGFVLSIYSGLIPVFPGSHIDVYKNQSDFYAAGVYSFLASWINLQVGYPISIPAHIANNYFVSVGLMIAVSLGIAMAKSSVFLLISREIKRRRLSWN